MKEDPSGYLKTPRCWFRDPAWAPDFTP